MAHFITTWRKPPPDIMEWEHHVSFHRDDAERVIENLKKQGVCQWHTWEIGEQIPELSQPVYTPTKGTDNE